MPRNEANVRQRRIARTLRDWRRSKGATQEEVAKPLHWSVPKLSRFERADTIAGPAEIIAIGTVLGIPEADRNRLVELAAASLETGWWNTYRPDAVRGDFEDYLEVETAATLLCSFETHLVPGLLQSDAYCEAILRAGVRNSGEELVAARLEVRRERQAALDASDDPLRYHAIIHESALQLPIGGTEVMREQLDFVLARCELTNVTVQVLPTHIGAYPGIGTGFHLVTFGPDGAQGVYLDNLHYGLYLEEETEVQVYHRTFDRLRELALDPEASSLRIAEIHQGQP
ncbi:helix-turn-helix domain-containing protein [Saccharopolyspora indica]|uniref:helix-turn-helix domain-containing protein n=1 Tax=Saccharopolyspora indica TaxID=1229659 RepID=UPI0022EAB910|nr:helix-turn-helix transcriptional regulator [Saccharopolyspora indica]MDA3645369.1 helix-turn-helix transcriptional regulator [Saccharopolyspora indica]